MKGLSPSSPEELHAILEDALRSGKAIRLRSRVLRERGEARLEAILEFLLERGGRADLAGPLHAAVRELVLNAGKANLKRILFEDLNVDAADAAAYQAGMGVFRKQLISRQLSGFASRIKARNLYIHVVFRHSPQVLIIDIENPFGLFAAEETRIREKFRQAAGADNLFDFYVAHGDQVEGAGMGIAMVLILLEQAGLSRRCLSIYTAPVRKCGSGEAEGAGSAAEARTISRIIVPLDAGYRTPRERFEADLDRRGCSAEELRAKVRSGEIVYRLLENAADGATAQSGQTD